MIIKQNILLKQKQNILCLLNYLQKKYKEVLSLAKKAHKILKCKGITRSDFRFFKNKFYLLEINTQPGMTKLSLSSRNSNYCGINLKI